MRNYGNTPIPPWGEMSPAQKTTYQQDLGQGGLKYCPSCERIKDRDNGFYGDGPTKKSRRCKDCAKTASKVRHAERTRVGLSPADCKHGTYNGYNSYGCRCEACVDAMAAYWRKSQYGLTKELEKAFIAAETCDICGGGFASKPRALTKVVDHCHETGAVRGFAHDGCNKMAGVPNGMTTKDVAATFEAVGLTHIANYLRR